MKHLLSILFCLFSLSVFAAEPAAEGSKAEGFNPGEMILHHIGDSHEWHWLATDNGNLTTYLPIIAYRPGRGLSVFSSKKISNGESAGPMKIYDGLQLNHEKLEATDGSKVYDFSVTKNVAALLGSAVLMLVVFTAVARGYRRNEGRAPSGIQSFFEPIIVFIRDEVAKKTSARSTSATCRTCSRPSSLSGLTTCLVSHPAPPTSPATSP